MPASSVLFIDDNEANVAGALSVGLHAEVYDLSSGVRALVELLRRYGLPIPAEVLWREGCCGIVAGQMTT